MNTAAYLKRQGWRGDGHSLDSTNRGLAKPLLVSHKTDSTGLGTKLNDFSNQWWLKAWDSKNTEKAAPVLQPSTGYAIARNPQLYSYFVRSKPLQGTLQESEHDMGKSKKSSSAADAGASSQISDVQPKQKSSSAAAPTTEKPKKDKKRKSFDTADVEPKEQKRSKKSKKDKSGSEGTAPQATDGQAALEASVAAPPSASVAAPAPSSAFYFDIVGVKPDMTVKPRVVEKQKKKRTRKGEKGEKVSKEEGPGKVNKAPDAQEAPNVTQSSENSASMQQPAINSGASANNIHGERLKMINGTKNSAPHERQKDKFEKPIIKPVKKHKVAQVAHFPDTSLSINEMVKRKSEEMKKPGPDGKIPKRRAPRTIRKEARAAKQAAADAEAAARGEVAKPVSIPMTKSERRYLRKNKPPTERKMIKEQRKLRKQEKARQGYEERKEIESEAQRLVDEMQANGTMPTLDIPVEEILAEKRAEVAAQKDEQKAVRAGQEAVDKLKSKGEMPLDKTEAEVLAEQTQKYKDRRAAIAQAKAEGKSWPPPRPGPDFSGVELPELDVPKFKTVTMGIPIPGTKKRGSVKQLRTALIEAGLTPQQQAAYIHKALQEKKEQRAVKDKIREEKRKARKAARVRKKQLNREKSLLSQKIAKANKKAKAAAEDPVLAQKLNKKAKKADNLAHNTNILLRQREAEKRERGEEVQAPTKLDIKQARRKARGLVRMAKKGRLSQEEVPKDFRLKRSQKLKLTGNGGRIPTWTAMEISDNIRSAQQDAIKAAEKSHREHPGSTGGKEKKGKGKDGIAEGASYIPL